MNDLLKETACLKEEEIQRYLSEQSSNEEIRRVEDHLLDCPFCLDAVEGLERYYSFEADDDLKNLTADIQRRDESTILEKAKVLNIKKRGRLLTLNRIAASILLFILPLSAWFYLNSNNSKSTISYGDNGTMRSAESGTEEENALLNVISLYEAKQYEAALAASQTMLSENREDVKTTYYAGLSALKSEEFQLAADYFITVRMNSDFYYEDATWMEAQAWVGAKNLEKATLVLDGIIEKGKGPFYEKAVALKQSLE